MEPSTSKPEGSGKGHLASRVQAPPSDPLTALPEDLLVRVLRPLSLAERQQSAALVCKRLYQACDSPAFLQQRLEIFLPWERDVWYFGDRKMLQKVRSLQAWLRPRAHLLRCLDLDIRMSVGAGITAHEIGMAGQYLGSTLAAAQDLQQLSFNWNVEFEASSDDSDSALAPAWAAIKQMSKLTSLKLSGDVGALPGWAQLAGMSELQQLQLCGLCCDEYELASEVAQCCLPYSITTLVLEFESNGGLNFDLDLAPVLRRLTALHSFQLRCLAEATEVRLVACTFPSSLVRLLVDNVLITTEVLRNMNTLHQLATFEVFNFPPPWREPDAEEVAEASTEFVAALQHMTQLTSLQLCIPFCFDNRLRDVWQRLLAWAQTHPTLRVLTFPSRPPRWHNEQLNRMVASRQGLGVEFELKFYWR